MPWVASSVLSWFSATTLSTWIWPTLNPLLYTFGVHCAGHFTTPGRTTAASSSRSGCTSWNCSASSLTWSSSAAGWSLSYGTFMQTCAISRGSFWPFDVDFEIWLESETSDSSELTFVAKLSSSWQFQWNWTKLALVSTITTPTHPPGKVPNQT